MVRRASIQNMLTPEEAAYRAMPSYEKEAYDNAVNETALASEDFPILPVSKTVSTPCLPDEADDNLTPAQRLAIAAIISGKTFSAAARGAGVSQRTLYTWRQQPNFRHQMNRLSRETLETVVIRVRNMMLRATRNIGSAVGCDSDRAMRVLNSKRMWDVLAMELPPAAEEFLEPAVVARDALTAPVAGETPATETTSVSASS